MGADQRAWSSWYDTTQGVVVRAATEKAARELAADRAGDEATKTNNPWLHPNQTTCEELLADGPEEVVMVDFNAG